MEAIRRHSIVEPILQHSHGLCPGLLTTATVSLRAGWGTQSMVREPLRTRSCSTKEWLEESRRECEACMTCLLIPSSLTSPSLCYTSFYHTVSPVISCRHGTRSAVFVLHFPSTTQCHLSFHAGMERIPM